MQILRLRYRAQEFLLQLSVLQQIREELIYQRRVRQLREWQHLVLNHHPARDRVQILRLRVHVQMRDQHRR